MTVLPYERPEIIAHTERMMASYKHWLGRPLLASTGPELLAYALYFAPFAVLSHDTQEDPIFTYANLTAQNLWEMNWEQSTSLPSRLSAEPEIQEERNRLIANATKNGYVSNYSGVRITSTGKRFVIKDSVLWNVLDERGEKIGQAVAFSQWHWL